MNQQKNRAESRRANKSKYRKHSRAKHVTSSSDDNSESYGDDESDIESHAKVKSGLRKKVSFFDGFEPLRATDSLCKRMLDYRYYRLERLFQLRKNKDTGRMKDQIKRMSVTLQNQTFDGEDRYTSLRRRRQLAGHEQTTSVYLNP